jgi:hypothetical protein
MHLYTVVRVRAETEEDAIAIVNGVLEDGYDFDHGFDYFGEAAISEHVTTEAEFQQKREEELAEYHEWLDKALALPDDNPMKGFYLRQAGNSLDADRFWTPCRLAYDYAKDHQDEDDGRVFFVVTDRHY